MGLGKLPPKSPLKLLKQHESNPKKFLKKAEIPHQSKSPQKTWIPDLTNQMKKIELEPIKDEGESGKKPDFEG